MNRHPEHNRLAAADDRVHDNSSWWDACEAHEWIHVGDELRCQQCGAEYPKRDPLVVGIMVAVLIVFLICGAIAVVVWCRGWWS